MGTQFISRKNSSLLILVALSLTTTSCRLGNYEEPPAPPNDARRLSGFYNTEAKTMFYCAEYKAEVEGESNDIQCAAVSTAEIPRGIQDAFTDPVDLFVFNQYAGDGYFYAHIRDPYNHDHAIEAYLNNEGTLVGSGTLAQGTLWDSSDCQEVVSLLEQGSVDEQGKRLGMDMLIQTSYDGYCTPSLEKMTACIKDATLCGGASENNNQQLQAAILNYWKRWLELGLLTTDNIVQLKSVFFQLSYR